MPERDKEKAPDEVREERMEYEILRSDRPVRSVREGAEYFGIAEGQTAPAMVIETEKGHYVVVKSGDRGPVDMSEMARLLGCQQVKLAARKDVERITGYKPGEIPLTGLTIPYVIDRRLFRYPFIYGGAREKGCTLKIAPQALAALNKVAAYWD